MELQMKPKKTGISKKNTDLINCTLFFILFVTR